MGLSLSARFTELKQLDDDALQRRLAALHLPGTTPRTRYALLAGDLRETYGEIVFRCVSTVSTWAYPAAAPALVRSLPWKYDDLPALTKCLASCKLHDLRFVCLLLTGGRPSDAEVRRSVAQAFVGVSSYLASIDLPDLASTCLDCDAFRD